MNITNMAAPARAPSGSGTPVAATGYGQAMSLLRALWASPRRTLLAGLAVAIVAVVCGNAAVQIRLNVWQGAFFDAIERRALAEFGTQLLVFLLIAGALLVLVVGQTWLHETLKLRFREWLTHDLLDKWLAPRRACLLAHAGEIGANPDQRMQEDARHLAELSADLAIGLLHATLLLLSFVGVLWLLSSQVVFGTGEGSFTIPGYMVWCALAYALSGSWLAWLVGRPLVRINAERYAREADFRFALVRLNDHADAIALHAGEGDERRALDGTVDRVIAIMRELARGIARLTWVTSGYGWFAIVVPILVAAPGYFGGSMSFGGLMMAVGAFGQVQQALRWFVDNFSKIADWRATLLRVVSFRETLLALDGSGDAPGRIVFAEHPEGNIAFDGLAVALAEGRAELDRPWLEVPRGSRILVQAEADTGMNRLLHAVAGLWPWGTGTVLLPPRASMMFLPERPYIPLGTLRAAVTYPADPRSFADAAVHAALGRVGLERLVTSLDRKERWDKCLALDEQQRLAFARLLLHAPSWVFLENATASLTEEQCRLMHSIFDAELAHATVIGIGRGPGQNGFYAQTLRLERRPAPPPQAPEPAPAPAPVPQQAGLVRLRPA
jgi:putative ATP-binding cassette transporter